VCVCVCVCVCASATCFTLILDFEELYTSAKINLPHSEIKKKKKAKSPIERPCFQLLTIIIINILPVHMYFNILVWIHS
jgi:hypothetical protein